MQTDPVSASPYTTVLNLRILVKGSAASANYLSEGRDKRPCISIIRVGYPRWPEFIERLTVYLIALRELKFGRLKRDVCLLFDIMRLISPYRHSVTDFCFILAEQPLFALL